MRAAPLFMCRPARPVSNGDHSRIIATHGECRKILRVHRYDKTVLSLESFLNLAAARLWLKSFVNAA
jgi:hypothetical protein